jgi:hypothetical protein
MRRDHRWPVRHPMSDHGAQSVPSQELRRHGKNATVLRHDLIDAPVSFRLIFRAACHGLQREECGESLRSVIDWLQENFRSIQPYSQLSNRIVAEARFGSLTRNGGPPARRPPWPRQLVELPQPLGPLMQTGFRSAAVVPAKAVTRLIAYTG